MNVTGTPFVCLRPKLIVNPYTHEKIMVPCGQCIACQSRKAARYETQIQLEAQNSHAVVFVSLTYANSHINRLKVVPVSEERLYDQNVYAFVDSETGELIGQTTMCRDDLKKVQNKAYLFGDIPYLVKSDVQKFMKRLRKSLSQYNNEKIRYYLCGEYGPEHFRPHFHILLFLKSDVFLTPTRKTLQDFPKWTWEHCKAARPDAPLSVVECAVRESWRFGSVDAELAKGGCARYVSSYVNGFSNLPKVLRMPQTKPFTSHSRFLGFELCKKEREKVYASTPESIVHGSLRSGEFYKEFIRPVSYTNVFFPKCKGYALKTDRERMFTYRLYLAVREEYPETPLTDVSIDLAMMLDTYFRQPEGNTLPAGFPPMLALALHYFNNSVRFVRHPFREYEDLDFKECMQEKPDFDVMVNCIYRELALSRHFLTFCCNGDYTHKATKLYYGKIKEFYNYIDRMKLARWYEEQQVFAEKDYTCDEDFCLFFDNLGLSVDEMKQSPHYQAFLSRCKIKEHKMIKHKIQNDLNGIFNNI